jgi:hypothetical protein
MIFTLATVITGRSEAEARAKHADYRRYADPEAALTLFPAGPALISPDTGRMMSFATSRPKSTLDVRSASPYSAINCLTPPDLPRR